MTYVDAALFPHNNKMGDIEHNLCYLESLKTRVLLEFKKTPIGIADFQPYNIVFFKLPFLPFF
jgi:hypothetical protein